ncbi:putative glycosyltransferases [Betalipothrixvirus acidiani]|uniref:Glycosyltransferases n=1 Tax=Betalipothrixvirus acidiani TaxID=346881 RepID=A7WKE6_9VIRU|nr:glycosyltransferase [Acidianus filamentous virus 3]CAJ31547.1 putative glycosyltransferases [Acidianus filamentous virus 3]
MKSIYTQCRNCSYEWVVDQTIYYMKKYHNIELLKSYFRPAHIYVGDCNTIFQVASEGIAWCDTPSDVTAKPSQGLKVITTSTWLKEHMEKKGIHVEQVIPRGVNDEMAQRFVNFDYNARRGYIIIGKNRPYKNIDKVIQLFEGRRAELTVISDHPSSDFNFFSLPENVKYYLLSHSLFYIAVSDAEGFNIPPVEAMSVGTPLIYVNKHAYKDYACGIEIDDVNDIRKIEISREEWEDLSWKCFYRSLRYYYITIGQELWGWLK